MRVLLTALGFLVALTLSAPLRAQSAPAPFGLQWGMEVSGLTERYMPLQSTTRTGDLTVVNLTKAPRAPAETYLVNLLFDREMGLVKVRWMSTDIKGDATGKNGRRKYREVRQYVVDSYGEPTDEALVIGARLFDQDDEFYQCLAYEGEGCGVWSAIWEQGPSGGILLSIEGLGPGSGFVQLDFESEGWKASVKESP
jgi:hypothetical protein